MRKITFTESGGVRIEQDEHRVTFLTADEVRQIAEGYELLYVIEDVKLHLTERYEDGCTDDDGDWTYDTDKYTPEVVRALAQEAIERKRYSEKISDTYWFIVDWVLDDYEKGAEQWKPKTMCSTSKLQRLNYTLRSPSTPL
ncbi:hypothetical protein AGMMS49573_10880 [Endomicrobiia bacterium]|nr:hypothetical protein AGMMS49573_10880 [Endomicrobiia bacterium]